MDLVLEQCLPSAREAEILGLFNRVGQPQFAEAYRRAYLPREGRGLRSWVGLAGSQAVLHISVSPQSFSDGTRTLLGGQLGDLMADDAFRDFWGPVKLARQMVADVRRDGTSDFLLTTFKRNAKALFKAVGFQPFGAMRRHVMPLVWPWPLVRSLMQREPLPPLTALPFADARIAALLPQVRSPGVFRPDPTPDFYATRMPRSEYPEGSWLVAGSADAPAAMVLVSPKQQLGEFVLADMLWRDADVPLSGLLSAVARWCAQRGFRRLTFRPMEGSPVEAAARRAGFVPREDAIALHINPLASGDRVPPAAQWFFTPFAGTGW